MTRVLNREFPQQLSSPPIESAHCALDFLCVASIFLMGLWIFGERSDQLGFYSDDAGFMQGLSDLSLSNLLNSIRAYVTGRNLHILWQYLIYCLTGNSLEALPAQHWIQAALTAINACMCFVLFRALAIPTALSFLSASIFLFYPTHAEVHFWLSSLPMNLVSTFFVLSLMIFGFLAVRAAIDGRQTTVFLLFVLNSVLFVSGFFTYDQAVPVLMAIILGTAAACFLASRPLRLWMVLYALGIFSVFVALLIWKIRVPGGGPALSPVSVAHLWSTFNQMVGETFSRPFKEMRTSLLHSGRAESTIAFCVALIVLSVGVLCQWIGGIMPMRLSASLQNKFSERVFRNENSYPLLLFFGGVVFYWLAYLPLYLWYLAPRHNYLPSIGFVLCVGALAGLLLAQMVRVFDRRVATICGFAFVVFVSACSYFAVRSILMEKNAWILSYQARKNLYADLLQDPQFQTASALILDGFPSHTPTGSAPLGYQQGTEPGLMTRNAVDVRFVVQDSAPSRNGEFIVVEPDQWGWNVFRHFTSEKTYHLVYQGLDQDRYVYSKYENGTRKATYYTIEELPMPSLHPDPNKPELRRDENGGVELTVPATTLGRDAVLVAVPLVINRGTIEPMTVPSYGRRRQVLVDVPIINDHTPRRFLIVFDKSMQQVRGVQLFVADEQTQRLVGEANILADSPR